MKKNEGRGESEHERIGFQEDSFEHHGFSGRLQSHPLLVL